MSLNFIPHHAGEVTHRFDTDPANSNWTAMFGTVNVQGYASITLRVRGYFGAEHGWGAWSPPAGLFCTPEVGGL